MPPTLRQDAQALLLETFTPNELRSLLLGMGVSLDAISSSMQPGADVMHEVVQWMHRRSRLSELIEAAAKERPGVLAWAELERRATSPGEAADPPRPPAGEGGRVAAPQPVGVPDGVTSLIINYLRVREVLEVGDARTVQMQNIVNQLAALPLEKYLLADQLHLSENDGERMAAVICLYRTPQRRYLRWLAERVATEDRFVAYQAALALRSAALKLPDADLDATAAAIRAAKSWVPEDERTPKGRYNKLREALEIIAKRAAGQAVP